MASAADRDRVQPPEQPLWIAPALAAVAGSVDGIGYLLLYKLFTSHMSGNTVAVTVLAARGEWGEVCRHTVPIFAFFAGAAVGFTLVAAPVLRNSRRIFSSVAAVEALLLGAFLLVGRPVELWTAALPAAAMGLQNAMLRRVAQRGIRTTFITGMLTNAAQSLVGFLVSLLARNGRRRKHYADLLLYAALYAAFAAGGIAGAAIELARGSSALLLPIAGLLLLIVYDLRSHANARALLNRARFGEFIK